MRFLPSGSSQGAVEGVGLGVEVVQGARDALVLAPDQVEADFVGMLDRRLHRLGAAVAEVHLVALGDAGQERELLRQPARRLAPRTLGVAGHLRLEVGDHAGHQLRRVVPEHGGAEAADQVQHLAAFAVGQPLAGRADVFPIQPQRPSRSASLGRQ